MACSCLVLSRLGDEDKCGVGELGAGIVLWTLTQHERGPAALEQSGIIREFQKTVKVALSPVSRHG
jgi:hypothetical protein